MDGDGLYTTMSSYSELVWLVEVIVTLIKVKCGLIVQAKDNHGIIVILISSPIYGASNAITLLYELVDQWAHYMLRTLFLGYI